jgi:UDP-glucose 4-epimerase
MECTVIVTGASGFIGRNTCLTFARQGYKVLGIGHGDWERQEWEKWGLTRWASSDITTRDLQLFTKNVQPFAIVHCAGSGAVSASYAAPYQDYQRSVDSTAQVLEFVRLQEANRPRIVLVSSAAIYGAQETLGITESVVSAPVSPYGYHKMLSENLCESYSRFFHMDISIVRLFSVYGAGLRKQLLWDAMTKFSNGEGRFLGTGNEFRDWIHVSDAANLLVLAATKPQSRFEIYNGGHNHQSIRNILTKLSQAANFSVVPTFSSEEHVGNPNHLTGNSQRASHQLGWNPAVSLEWGLNDYAKWYAEEGYL